MCILHDFLSMDADLAHMYRRCMGGSYTEYIFRSQRDLFGTFLDRPAGMPDIMAGQPRPLQ